MASDLESYEVKKGSGVGGLFLGILIGAVAGGIAALLLAPRSGRETQQMLKDKASQTQQMLQSRVNTVKQRVGQIRDNMRSEAEKEAQSVEKSV